MNNEMEKIYEWACSEGTYDVSRNIFKSDFREKTDTFWCRYDQATRLKEMGSYNYQELDRLLRKMWDGNEKLMKVVPVVEVSYLKNRPRKSTKCDELKELDNKLPTYIYNF